VRIRDELVARDDVNERRMLGGLTFMVGGPMCCGVLDGRLVLRLGEEGAREALSEPPHGRRDLAAGPPRPDGVIMVKRSVRWREAWDHR
jgi:TfoX/Sxy family transcriptional regulator of competence genes